MVQDRRPRGGGARWVAASISYWTDSYWPHFQPPDLRKRAEAISSLSNNDKLRAYAAFKQAASDLRDRERSDERRAAQ